MHVRSLYAAKLQEAEKKVQELKKDTQNLQATAKKVNSLEKQLSEKDAEVQQVMQEGEELSRKQLHMETTIKQLKSDIGSMRSELIETTDALALERQKIDLLTKENKTLQETLNESTGSHDQVLAHLKSEHEKTVRELRTELIAAERRVESMEKVGSSRKLRDAEAKCEALQESIESLRDEMRRQREHADEREDMLSAEVSALSQKCAEAEVRQQDYQNKLPQATAPLLQEIEELRQKLEDQEQRAIATQKKLMSQIKQLEHEKDDLSTRVQQAQDTEEELKIRYDTLYSQLLSTQQSSVESEKVAAQERSARDNAESLLREATSELKALEASVSSMEKVFNAQIESMASKESSLQETIRNLEEQVSSLKDAQNNHGIDHSPSPPSTILPATDNMLVEEQIHMTLLDENSDDASLLRKIRDLESTRDKLSNALVQAEQQVAKGRAATSRIEALTVELSDLRKKLAAATEILGEREERIEELRADLIDVKEGYKQQLVIMADEITRLTAQQQKKDILLSTPPV
jgi:chromosome segregation ATPase